MGYDLAGDHVQEDHDQEDGDQEDRLCLCNHLYHRNVRLVYVVVVDHDGLAAIDPVVDHGVQETILWEVVSVGLEKIHVVVGHGDLESIRVVGGHVGLEKIHVVGVGHAGLVEEDVSLEINYAEEEVFAQEVDHVGQEKYYVIYVLVDQEKERAVVVEDLLVDHN